jgi:hypothetical protein
VWKHWLAALALCALTVGAAIERQAAQDAVLTAKPVPKNIPKIIPEPPPPLPPIAFGERFPPLAYDGAPELLDEPPPPAGPHPQITDLEIPEPPPAPTKAPAPMPGAGGPSPLKPAAVPASHARARSTLAHETKAKPAPNKLCARYGMRPVFYDNGRRWRCRKPGSVTIDQKDRDRHQDEGTVEANDKAERQVIERLIGLFRGR